MFNFLSCAFKIIIIKGFVYIQCERWVIKLSSGSKALGQLCHKRKIILLLREEFYA